MKFLLKILPWCLLALFATEIVVVLLPKKDREMHTAEFGRLPVLLNGRIQPFDSVARNSLRETLYDAHRGLTEHVLRGTRERDPARAERFARRHGIGTSAVVIINTAMAGAYAGALGLPEVGASGTAYASLLEAARALHGPRTAPAPPPSPRGRTRPPSPSLSAVRR